MTITLYDGIDILWILVTGLGVWYSTFALRRRRRQRRELNINGPYRQLARFNVNTEFNRLISLIAFLIVGILSLINNTHPVPDFIIIYIVLMFIAVLQIVANSRASFTIDDIIQQAAQDDNHELNLHRRTSDS